jgi:hypothetical protein
MAPKAKPKAKAKAKPSSRPTPVNLRVVHLAMSPEAALVVRNCLMDFDDHETLNLVINEINEQLKGDT